MMDQYDEKCVPFFEDKLREMEEGVSGKINLTTPRFNVPLSYRSENESESDDFDREMKCRNQITNKIIGGHNNISSESSMSGTQLSSPTGGKNPKKKVDKFYRRQSDLMENFKKDSTVIEESQRRRKKLSEPPEESNDSNNFLMESSLRNGSVDDEVLQNGFSTSNTIKRKLVDPIESKEEKGLKAAKYLTLATLIINICLVVSKAIAAYLSGSLSIISSLVDSSVDITSGFVIWLTARAIKKRDPYMYPRGRTRLEPIALIIVSVIMGVASLQMIFQSFESIIRQTVDPHVDTISLCIMAVTVVVKFLLMLSCKRFSNDSSMKVLMQDHRNDCISNIVALTCAWAASNYCIYIDPAGAIVVSVYIALTWFFTGREHLTMLSGRSAEPEFINRIVKICMEHDDRIDYIDTVYVYHFATRFLVEVHIVMDKNMSLKVAHDISESLQISIESLAEVERAFVHCDYEFDHMPNDEHKPA